MRICAAIAILAIAATARAQFFTPAEVQWLDFRYGGAASGESSLTTNTLFGNNVTGRWNTLDVVITNLGPRLAGTGLTARANGMLDVTISGSSVTADTTTVTNDGSGQFSVKNYDTNAAAILFYAINNRKTWDDMQTGIRAATWDEMKSSPFAATWDDMK